MTERPPLDDEPVSVRSLYPEDDTYDKSMMKLLQRKKEHVKEAVSGADTIVIADTDLDGLGCATVVKEHHGTVDHVQASHDERVRVETTLDIVSDVVGPESGVENIYICDLPPNNASKYLNEVAALAETATVIICDHHDTWTDSLKQAAGRNADVHIGNGISATEVTFNAVQMDADENWERFVALVTDHDCGQRDDDPDSTRLADYAEAVSGDEFVNQIIKSGGQPLQESEVQRAIEEHRQTKDKQIEYALRRLQIHDGVEEATLVTTYGRCPASQTAERLFDDWDADIAVLIKPNDKINVRTTDEYPVAREIAEKFWGGGHDDEAGAKPGFYGNPPTADLNHRGGEWYRDSIPWAEHWATMGREARERVEMAVQHVLDEQQ